MQVWRIYGVKLNGTVDFNENSKTVVASTVAFNNENNGKNMKIGFIYKLKGFLFFRGMTSSTYGVTYARSGGKR